MFTIMKNLLICFLVEPKTFTTIIYGFSVLSGPALAIAVASIWCLVPFHNVLKEPCYWYEFHIAVILTYIPFMVWVIHPLVTEFWLNFDMNRSIVSFLFLNFAACGTFITATAIYYYQWKDLTQPMPFNGLIAGTLAFLVSIFAILARYTYLILRLIKRF